MDGMIRVSRNNSLLMMNRRMSRRRTTKGERPYQGYEDYAQNAHATSACFRVGRTAHSRRHFDYASEAENKPVPSTVA